MQLFGPCRRGYFHVRADKGPLEQAKGSRTAGSVARDLCFASVRVEKPRGKTWGGRPDYHPSVGADAGIARADAAGNVGKVVGWRVFGPGQQKVVLGTVELCKGQLNHCWSSSPLFVGDTCAAFEPGFSSNSNFLA